MPKLLIVDDKVSLLSVLKHAWEGEYQVLCAESGEEALRILPVWHPDLVITDYEMPTMTGLEFVQVIKKIGNGKLSNREKDKVKIILYSACLTDELRHEAEALGVDACVTKPFNLVEFRKIIAEVLGKEKK